MFDGAEEDVALVAQFTSGAEYFGKSPWLAASALSMTDVRSLARSPS